MAAEVIFRQAQVRFSLQYIGAVITVELHDVRGSMQYSRMGHGVPRKTAKRKKTIWGVNYGKLGLKILSNVSWTPKWSIITPKISQFYQETKK